MSSTSRKPHDTVSKLKSFRHIDLEENHGLLVAMELLRQPLYKNEVLMDGSSADEG